jgi:hypothetical protein
VKRREDPRPDSPTTRETRTGHPRNFRLGGLSRWREILLESTPHINWNCRESLIDKNGVTVAVFAVAPQLNLDEVISLYWRAAESSYGAC